MSRLALALSTLVLACGTTEAPPTAPTPTAPTPAPAAPPARFVPANAELRIPVGEDRGIAGTDVVLRVDAPHREGETCTVHVALRAGTDAHDETIACESPVIFHGLTIVPSGDAPMVDHDLVAVTLASNGPAEALTDDCASDDDCVLARFSCCSAPPCDDSAYNRDVLAFLEDRCAHRVCPPHEPRPCGAEPEGASARARCVDGRTCQVVQ